MNAGVTIPSACQVNGVPTPNVCNKIILPSNASAAAIAAAQSTLLQLFPPALNITLEVITKLDGQTA